VVVKPLMVSKKASATVVLIPVMRKGSIPTRVARIQEKVTTANPSRRPTWGDGSWNRQRSSSPRPRESSAVTEKASTSRSS